ncbi:MAG: S-layer homology domain-containing protein [Clostridia bacterium]|nr:S-layer homology domain-containing protein [Clostridia bacterium]
MMNTKRISAVLLVAVMLISMLSCMVIGTSADSGSGLGSPVTVEEVGGTLGKELPNGIKIVNDDWAGKTGKVALRLDGVVYSAWMGQQAFGDVADAAAVAKTGDTVYVAPGNYNAVINITVSDIRFYGPYAGVSPNVTGSVTALADANAARPGATVMDTTVYVAEEDTAGVGPSADQLNLAYEAVIRQRVNLQGSSENVTVDGFYFADKADIFNQSGGKYRNGTYFKNNIFNLAADIADVFSLNRSYSGDFQIINNRILSGTQFARLGNLMDLKVLNNYINVTGYACVMTSAEGGSAGDTMLMEGNYFPQSAGLFTYTASTAQVILQGLTFRNNYIADCVNTDAGMIKYMFDGKTTLPGTNINVIGNTFMGMESGVAPFDFYYTPYFANSVTYRYVININENIFDMAAGAPFVSSGVNGVLNCAYNYYTNGSVALSQIAVDAEDAQVLLYPYYNDAEMTQLVYGSSKIVAVEGYTATINNDEKLVTLDLTGTDLDQLDITDVIKVSDGCTWKLFEDATMATESTNKMLYLDGQETFRYIQIIPEDDGLGDVYRLRVVREAGKKAELLDVIFDTTGADLRAGDDTSLIYELDPDLLFLNYTLKVSSGATYALYSDSACTTALEDLNGYIPYGGYTVYAKITSEDGKTTNVYSLVFNRTKSAYEPTVTNVETDDGNVVLRNDLNWLTCYLNSFMEEASFVITTTAGSTYKVYTDAACTKEITLADGVCVLPMANGANTFYVKVTDGNNNSNVITFVVENGAISSDATILDIPAYTTTIADNVISMNAGGASASFFFKTRNEYATCKIYADANKTLEIPYESATTTDPLTGKVQETRTFDITSTLKIARYYVVCTAEDGTTQDYTLLISRGLVVKDYADLTDLNAWYADYVLEATDKGLMIGSNNAAGEYVFRANDYITRQEMAIVVCRLLGVNGACYDGVTLSYKDNADIADWAMGFVKACYLNGYMTGSGTGDSISFLPNNNISRQEVMVIFARIFELNESYDLSAFKDAFAVADWAKEEVEAVVASGMIQGSDGCLNPTAPITRAEMAALCTRSAIF